ncbi:transcriptional regulator, AsnC family [Rhizobium sp. RU20A]|uniref:Lrp/AsnC family transcriptional regulator n=1 Tax=Rhizobium sp. RU20A TaxID=1907412 RepID=UPI000956EC5D|nr:Lrp/AsnC family transcriptional regulator [Rhizobium sp. RU20A]SIR39290.1 transcriptional regulator, AsnC family [Rhizobium sp. RU20A]
MSVTERDRELLSLLQENARMPTATIARRLGLSRTTVQARLERLERDGVITGYGVRLSDGYSAAMVRAHVLITIAPRALGLAVKALSGIRAVRTLHSVSGHYDLIAIVEAPSVHELDGVIDTIGALDGVEKTQSSIILSTRIDR